MEDLRGVLPRLASGFLAGGELPVDRDGPTDQPFRPFPAADLESPVFARFARIAAAFPDRRAVIGEEGYYSYRELHGAALALAVRIAATVGPGEPVGVALPNGARYPVALLAALACGRPYLPFDLGFPEARNGFIARHAGLRAIVVDDETRETVRRLAPDAVLIDFTDAADESGNEVLDPGTARSVAFVLYTSGSTGEPKGVYYDQASLLLDAMRRINTAHIGPDDRVAQVFAPTVSAAQQDIFGALLSGATLVVVNLLRDGLQALVRVIRRERVTLLFCIGLLFRRLVALCRETGALEEGALATLRHVCIGGERIFAADIELFRRNFPPTAHLSIGLGSSETNEYLHWFVARDRVLGDALVPVGQLMPGYALAFAGDDGNPVPPGEIGEMVVASRYLALGYWNDPALSAAAFATLPDDPSVRIFATGDLARLAPDGLIELVGRKDRQVKIRGNRVEPAEIEAVIRRHPDITDAAVVPRPVGETAEIVAYAVPTATADLDESRLFGWLADKLSDAMRPRRVYLVPSIPMLGNFKHDIPALQRLDRERAETEAR